MSNGLNRLAARIGELLAHERETLADLSHRLRTPLTALRIDAESLSDDEEVMSRVIGDVDALTRTVNEIIAEARRPAGDGAAAHLRRDGRRAASEPRTGGARRGPGAVDDRRDRRRSACRSG